MRKIRNNILEKNKMSPDENPCWKGYEMIGTKMKDGKEVPNCVPISKENVKLYLSKNLLEDEFKEIDMGKVKKTIGAGVMAGSLLFPTSDVKSSSDYFRNISYNPTESSVSKLSDEEKLKVYKQALEHHFKGDGTYEKLKDTIEKLRKKIKTQNPNFKEKELRLSNRRKQQLDEISFEDVKNIGKKAIVTTLLVSSSFLPIVQSLYGNDSCNIDSSGEVVSCDITKLESKKTVTDLLKTVKLGISIINNNLNDPTYEYHKDFTKDEIDAVKNKLNQLESRKLTPEEKLLISKAKEKTKELENTLNKVLKKNNKKENFKLYLCKRLDISLNEAILLEKEIRNYIKMK